MTDDENNTNGEDRYAGLMGGLNRLADEIDRQVYPGLAWPSRRTRRAAPRFLLPAAVAAAAAAIVLGLAWLIVDSSFPPRGKVRVVATVTPPATQTAPKELWASWSDVSPAFVPQIALAVTGPLAVKDVDASVAGGFSLEIPQLSWASAGGTAGPGPQTSPTTLPLGDEGSGSYES